MSGQSHLVIKKSREQPKKVTFEDDKVEKLEYCHNLIMQVHPNPREDVEYATSHVMLIARYMDDINAKIMTQGASFVQVKSKAQDHGNQLVLSAFVPDWKHDCINRVSSHVEDEILVAAIELRAALWCI